MNLSIPRDFASYPAFRRLVIEVGNEPDATYLMMRLWVELGYQAEQSLQSGYFDAEAIPSFNASLMSPGHPVNFTQLLAAKMVIPFNEEGRDYICPIFDKANPDINPEVMSVNEQLKRQQHFQG